MIVCLGWGSLIWSSETLPVVSEWQTDGPFLPVEFLRQSQDGKLTLVIDPASKPLQTLWAELEVRNLSDAVEQLRVREGRLLETKIGRWPNGNAYQFSDEVGNWAVSKGITGVVWTALGPKFSGCNNRRPSQEEAVAYLSGLNDEKQQLARAYIEKAHEQIDTDYRRAFKKSLGW